YRAARRARRGTPERQVTPGIRGAAPAHSLQRAAPTRNLHRWGGRWVRLSGSGGRVGRASRSGGEHAVADAGAGLAVVQEAEPGRETLIGVAMLGGDGVDVPDGLDHAGRVGQER